jgi:hypothetical protein
MCWALSLGGQHPTHRNEKIVSDVRHPETDRRDVKMGKERTEDNDWSEGHTDYRPLV